MVPRFLFPGFTFTLVGNKYLLRFYSVFSVSFLALSIVTASGSVELPLKGLAGWDLIGKGRIQPATNSILITGGYLVTKEQLDDAEISFRARAPVDAPQVQIWAGLRQGDRDSRYVFALRGGSNNDIYFARYAPDGGAKFLGFAPLNFKPIPGEWFRLRIVAMGNHFMIFLNNEKLPRLNVEDSDASWNRGGAVLGGGWLPAEFTDFQMKPLAPEDKTAFLAIGDKHWAAPKVDKEALRKSQRAGYTPIKVTALNPLRTEISLDGNWLFLPDYQLRPGQNPSDSGFGDQNWHVMPVPSFWTPALSWLHGETSFPELSGVSTTKGVAESLYVQRVQQCDALTFDWRRTSAAWYREYVDLSSDLGGHRFELAFDAVAKVSEVWVNGIKVGVHTGMFSPMKCDVTAAIRPGRNVIAVHVTSRPNTSSKSSNKVEGVAVTVEVTSAMLHSLPHGMFQDDVGGIWQPVKLTATSPALVSDAFIEPGLHGANINLDIMNSGSQSRALDVEYTIVSTSDGSLLYSNGMAQSVVVPLGTTSHLKLITPYLDPKLWSPQDPNLYQLEVRLKQQGVAIDEYKLHFGFRTFSVADGKFLLNGQPFWLRGANPFPNTLCPNDGALARQFIDTARAGNIRVTRSHIVPFTPAWLDAADEAGMAVSFEGTWPWLMLEGEPPGDDLVKVWKDEFISLIKEYRNHPSIILWTVNNEMKFEQIDQKNLPLLNKKWAILNDAIKAIRQADPTRPIDPDSSYVRKETKRGYQTVVKPEGLDDGDVDDLHRYYGWYNESFFHLYNGSFNQLATPGRPLISQEMSTGYPNNDDGHATRYYLFKHYTPQALVGDDAYENADPAIFLKRQAFMTKELVETIRRTSHDTSAGLLMFSYFTWFQTPWLIGQIKPWPAYYAMKTAMQPILVSAELFGRHFYAGTTFRRRVCVINDTEDCQAIHNCQLVWEFRCDDKKLSQGQMDFPSVDYYKAEWLKVEFATPENLPAPRVNGQLVLRLLSNGKVLSENNYDIVLATHEWANSQVDKSTGISLWNPNHRLVGCLAEVPTTTVASIELADPKKLLIIGNSSDFSLRPKEADLLKEFISVGGRVLMLHPGKSLVTLFPEQVKAFKAKKGEIVTLHVPESPAFYGIEPLDLSWFERGGRNLPIACTGVYQISSARHDTIALAQQCDIHAYLKNTSEIAKISGTPLLEIQSGKGCLIASEMNLESGEADPISRRLLSNIINYLENSNK
jgi:beta-galactosidase